MYLYRTHRRVFVSWGVANHVNIIELKHVDEDPTNDNHSTDGFEKIIRVVAFYLAFRKFCGRYSAGNKCTQRTGNDQFCNLHTPREQEGTSGNDLLRRGRKPIRGHFWSPVCCTG